MTAPESPPLTRGRVDTRPPSETAGAGPTPGPGRIRPLARRWLSRGAVPALVFAGSRLATVGLIGVLAKVQGLSVMRLLRYWDSQWYLTVAQYGYPHTISQATGNAGQSALGFFPALPLVIRCVHLVTGLGYDGSGVAAAAVAGLVGAIVLWRLLAELEPGGATRGTALVLLSPASFVLSMVYGEGLLIAAVSGCLLALRRRHWLVAGLCGAVASATDPLGMAIVAVCVVAAVVALRRDRDFWSVLAPAVAAAGIGAFCVYLWVHTGTPFAWFETQRHGWQQGGFGAGVVSVFDAVLLHWPGGINALVKAAGTIVFVGLLVAWWRWPGKRPDPLVATYVLGVAVLALLSPVIALSPRVLLRAFPLLGVLGARLSRRAAVVACTMSALAMVGLTVASLALSASLTP